MNVDLSDIQRTIDLKLASLSLDDIESLDDVVKRGLTALELESHGMKVSGFNEETIRIFRTLLADARKALKRDASSAKPVMRHETVSPRPAAG